MDGSIGIDVVIESCSFVLQLFLGGGHLLNWAGCAILITFIEKFESYLWEITDHDKKRNGNGEFQEGI